MNTRKILSIIFLTITLGVIPIGSWYYLKQGLNYRKQRIGSLNAFGNWGDSMSLKLINGKDFSTDSLRGRFVVVSVFDPADSTDKNQIAAGKQLQRFQDAFGKERSDIYCLSLPIGQHTDSALVAAYAQRYHANSRVWRVAKATSDIPVLVDSLNLVKFGKIDNPLAKPLFALVDNKFKIRNYYDGSQKEDVNAMIEVISIIMPPKAVPSIKYRKPEER